MSKALMHADYLFIGPLIEARLAASLPELTVSGIEQLAQATERNVRSLDAFVLWDGESFGANERERASRDSVMVDHLWTVLLAIRNASQVNADARNRQAGQVLSGIHRSLHGWTPDGLHRPLLRANGRKPSYGNSTALYPLTFSITLNI